jgi:hypothetical protein
MSKKVFGKENRDGEFDDAGKLAAIEEKILERMYTYFV